MRLVVLLHAAATVAPVDAHGGGLNKQGCHNDRQNGGSHCHRGNASAMPRRPPMGDFAPRSGERLTNEGTPSGAFAYRNCDAARAAGAAPVRRGDAGYGPHLDRDNDGIGCEPYRGR